MTSWADPSPAYSCLSTSCPPAHGTRFSCSLWLFLESLHPLLSPGQLSSVLTRTRGLVPPTAFPDGPAGWSHSHGVCPSLFGQNAFPESPPRAPGFHLLDWTCVLRSLPAARMPGEMGDRIVPITRWPLGLQCPLRTGWKCRFSGPSLGTQEGRNVS